MKRISVRINITPTPFHITRGSKSLFNKVPLAFIATRQPVIRICLRFQVAYRIGLHIIPYRRRLG